jgi:hypothetical protein
MKTNYLKFLLSVLFAFAIAPAFSQFTGGIDLAIPSGSWSDGWGAGFGVSARYEKEIQDKLNWTASAGFVSFSGKSFTTIVGFNPTTGQPIYGTEKYSSVTVIPVTGGIKYYFQESNTGFYGAADIGFFIASGGGSSSTKFGFSPGIGYRLEKFDFTFRYNAVSDVNYLGLRAAYIFTGK